MIRRRSFHTTHTRSSGRTPIDLAALAIIVTVPVVLAVFTQAEVAVITATGGLIVGALHTWLASHKR